MKQDFANNLENIKIKVVETRFYVKTLNMEIVKRLVENGVPALTVSPMEFGDLHSSEFKGKIQKLLNDGYIPVMHGDLNFNVKEEFPFSITSGDTILDVLSEQYISHSSIFISDVFGAFLNCPNDESKNCESVAMKNGLIKTIQIQENGEKVMELYESSATEKNGEITTQVVHSHDVTGGFEKKLTCAFDIAKRSQNVFILKANTPNLFNVVEGREFVGTKIFK